MTPANFIHLRTKLGWSQNRLAENLGVNRSTVHRWEKGLRKIPPMAERLLATIGGNTRKSKAG